MLHLHVSKAIFMSLINYTCTYAGYSGRKESELDTLTLTCLFPRNMTCNNLCLQLSAPSPGDDLRSKVCDSFMRSNCAQRFFLGNRLRLQSAVDDMVAVAMHFAMKNGLNCFSLRKFLAISPAIQKSLAIAVAMPWCTYVKGRQTGGFQTGAFPDLDLSFLFCQLFCPTWGFPDFSGTFPICPEMVRFPDSSLLFLSLSYEEQSRKGLGHNLDLSRKKVGSPPDLETPRY